MLVSRNSILRDALFFLLALYFAQGPLYSTGSIIGKISLLGILLISSFFFVKSLALKASKPILFYSIALLLAVNFFGFFSGGTYGGTHYSQIRNITTALLPFFSFYYLAKKGCLEEKHLLFFLLLMLPVVMLNFYYSKSSLLSELAAGREDVVTNTAYLFVALIPFVFYWGERKVFAIVSLLVLIFFITQGGKRGALITASIGVLVFAYYQFINTPPDKKVRSYVIALIGLFSIVAFALYFYGSNEFLMRRMQTVSEGGSGRNVIYTNLLAAWYTSDSFLNYLFGFGFVATVDKSGLGQLAHNDWLELLTNFGLLGVAIYFFLFFSLVRYIVSSAVPKTSRLVMLAIVSMWFLQTLFSMYYTSSSTAITMVVLGYLVGTQKFSQNKGGI